MTTTHGTGSADRPRTGRAATWAAAAWAAPWAGYLPLAATIAAAGLSVVSLWWVVPTALCSFTAGWRPGRTWSTAVGLIGAVAAGVVAVAAVPSWITWADRFVAVVAGAVVLPWFVGRFCRQYRELVRAGWERAARLEREQRLIAEQARLRERARIAQDMHDVLGHELSLIALSAGALKLAPGLADGHREAARDIRARAAAAVDRLGEVIGVLRQEPDGAPQEPDGDGVAELVERASASGLAVRLRIEGETGVPGRTGVPGEPGEPLPDVERAVHRVVREALTNVAKHAPGAEATVHVRHTPEETEVRVANGPAPTAAPDRPGGAGFGLIGLDERVRLAGGTFDYGPESGGFAVRATFPPTRAARRPTQATAAHPPYAANGTGRADVPDGPGGASGASGAGGTSGTSGAGGTSGTDSPHSPHSAGDTDRPNAANGAGDTDAPDRASGADDPDRSHGPGSTDTSDRPDGAGSPDAPDRPDCMNGAGGRDDAHTPDLPHTANASGGADVRYRPDRPNGADGPHTPHTANGAGGAGGADVPNRPDRRNGADRPHTPDRPDAPHRTDGQHAPNTPHRPHTPHRADAPHAPHTPHRVGAPQTPHTPHAPGSPVGDGAPVGDDHRRARRRLGRTLVAALMVPLVAAALLTGALRVWDTLKARESVLAPDGYARLRIGQDRDRITPYLPKRQTGHRPTAAEPRGAGLVCEYYAMTADPFDDRSGDVYRLCFRHGTLVSTDAFTGTGVR
ncbi:sensor histidine kinase [Streptomyces malaysiensis]|uniref:sensor histidine kinase n=1 Tax=Streptomyces malaysiensis TaxID=92644 RepID=UPI00372026E0